MCEHGYRLSVPNSLETDINTGRRGHVAGVAVDWEGTSIEDGEVWLAKVQQLLVSGANEHVVHEQSMVRPCTHNSDLDSSLHRQQT